MSSNEEMTNIFESLWVMVDNFQLRQRLRLRLASYVTHSHMRNQRELLLHQIELILDTTILYLSRQCENRSCILRLSLTVCNLSIAVWWIMMIRELPLNPGRSTKYGRKIHRIPSSKVHVSRFGPNLVGKWRCILRLADKPALVFKNWAILVVTCMYWVTIQVGCSIGKYQLGD